MKTHFSTQKNPKICWIGVWFGCSENKETMKERSLIEISTANQSKIKWSAGNKMCTIRSLWCFPVGLSNQIKRRLAVCHWRSSCGKNHLMSIFQIAFNCVQWYFYHIIHLLFSYSKTPVALVSHIEAIKIKRTISNCSLQLSHNYFKSRIKS